MKKIYALTVILFSFVVLNAQFKLGTAYSLSIPQGEMGDNIGAVHSLNVSILHPVSKNCNRFIVGAELGIGNYAYITKEQDLRFSDGSGIKTDVIYTSNVFNGSVMLRANVLDKGNVIPYIITKAGYTNFFSNVVVEDPEDASSCEALERKNIIKDHTFFGTYGGGLQVDLNLFSKKAQQGKTIIDVSINKIKGGKINYINTKNIQSYMETDPNNPMPAPKGEPLNIQFVNISTQMIHEHQVAELYTSPLRMLDIRIGMVFRLR